MWMRDKQSGVGGFEAIMELVSAALKSRAGNTHDLCAALLCVLDTEWNIQGFNNTTYLTMISNAAISGRVMQWSLLLLK